MGRFAKSRGDALEDQLDYLHQIYRANALAMLWHNGVKASMHRGEWVPEDSLPDYGGVLSCLDGRYVTFDAKLISEPKYNHPKDKMHQCRQLREVQLAGGCSFLLIVVDRVGIEAKGWALLPQDYWLDYRGWSISLVDPDPALALPIPASPRFSGGFIPDWIQLIDALKPVGAS